MPLIIKKAPKVANKDIVCYKLILSIDGKYFTPFTGYDIGDSVNYVKLGSPLEQETMTSKMEKCKTSGKSYSIYRNFDNGRVYFIEGDEIKHKNNGKNDDSKIKVIEQNVKIITNGFFHTYKSLKDLTVDQIIVENKKEADGLRIVKCIIPENTIYYSGHCYSADFDKNYPKFNSYASTNLLLLKDVTDKYKNKLNYLVKDELTEEKMKILHSFGLL